MSASHGVREAVRWGALLVGVLTGVICSYFTFMYGSLSVAPSPVQDHYRFLANLSLYLGISGLLLGLIVFLLLKKRQTRDKPWQSTNNP
jgi:NADH:ubiquinone oxidoreductase subunit 6 (subunit J)